MKIIVRFELKKAQLPLDYRRLMVSFLKASFTSSEPELFKQFYEKGKTVQKPFAFDVKLPKASFEKESILLDSEEIQLTIILEEKVLGIRIYNAIVGMKKEKVEYPVANGNSMKVKSVRIEEHRRIVENQVVIQMLSPLVFREHKKGEKDYYYQADDEEFINIAKEIIQAQVSNLKITSKGIDIVLEPIKTKKVIIKTFGINIPASLGIFKLSANEEIINILYQIGIGSRRSEGFGVFEIIEQKKGNFYGNSAV